MSEIAVRARLCIGGCGAFKKTGSDGMCAECAAWFVRETGTAEDLDAPQWQAAGQALTALSPDEQAEARRFPVVPRTYLGLAVEHYPARVPIADVFPRLRWREQLCLASGLLIFAGAAGYAVWVCLRALVLVGLQLSGGLR